jgi:hypothetical protein
MHCRPNSRHTSAATGAIASFWQASCKPRSPIGKQDNKKINLRFASYQRAIRRAGGRSPPGLVGRTPFARDCRALQSPTSPPSSFEMGRAPQAKLRHDARPADVQMPLCDACSNRACVPRSGQRHSIPLCAIPPAASFIRRRPRSMACRRPSPSPRATCLFHPRTRWVRSVLARVVR